jgi:F-type H+-transporting ATPase subunit b
MEIQVTSILLQMLNFGVVVGLLTFLLVKPVRKMLEERAEKIAAGQRAAEAALKEKSSIDSLKEQAEREARSEAKKILAEARTEAEARKEELMAEVKTEVQKARDKALKSVETERKAALENMQAEFEKAVLAVAESVIGTSLDSKEHAALIKKALKDIAA